MKSEIVEIYLTATAGAPMHAVASVDLESDKGIVGDRYHASVGTFSQKLRSKGRDDWQVTLIEAEELDSFVKAARLDLHYGDFRRNIITRGVRLNDMVGGKFRIAAVIFEGIRLCEPCAHLASLVNDSVLPGLVGRGGLRARIVQGGVISVGDIIEAQ